MNFSEVQVDHESIKKMLDVKWLGIESISKIDEEDAVAKGENYGSIMRRLKITGTDPSGATVRKNIIMKKDKVMPGDVELDIFKCEIQAYTQILPKMEKLIDEAAKNEKMEVLWPVCVGVRNYDVILLEDLVEAGYSMRNRRIPMSSNEAIFSVGHLGRFHGLSLAAMKRKIIDPNILTANKFASNLPVLNNVLSGGLYTLADKLENDSELKSVVPKMRALANNVGNELVTLAEKTKDIFPVINHGDCWSNNLLFKYSGNTDEPISMRYVDYQNVNLGCFAWDVISLTHTSMSAQTRQSCYKQIMENYRNCLVRTLEALHEDTSDVPSLHKMFDIMDQFALFALIAVCSLFPLTINTLEKPWEFEKTISNNSSNSHQPELYENEIFKESFKLEAKRFKSQGLL